MLKAAATPNFYSCLGLRATALCSKHSHLEISPRSMSAHTSHKESFNDGTYLQKLDEAEKVFHYGHIASSRYPTTWYTLNSKKPLSPDIVYKTMEHMHRRSSIHQLAVRERDGDLWWYHSESVKMDFQTVEKGLNKYDIIDKTLEGGFDNENGPLWKIRFIPASEDDPCPVPSMKKEYPYQSYLLTVPHHGVADGITLIILTQPAIDMLNAVIEGESIDDTIPLGEFRTSSEFEEAEQTIRANLLKDPLRFEAIKAEVIKGEKPPLLERIFPRPVVDNATTKHLILHGPMDARLKFLDRCKKNGVSPGTGIQNAYSTSFIELAQEKGATDDSYDIRVNLPADLRRFMEKRKYPALGLLTKPVNSLITMTKNVRTEFWNNCRTLQDINNKLVNPETVVEHNLVRQMLFPSAPAHELYKGFPKVTRDFGFSNLGNVNKMIRGEGKHVQISAMEQCQSMHKCIFPCFLHYYAYRRTATLAMNYATDWMTLDNATELENKIASVITYHSEN